MGGIVSPGIDNDDLIDKLIEAKYIRSALVERVFRTVDRAFYFLPEFRRNAYRDQAWKHENLHLSAPCIYSEVLEQLNLKNGQSFLNIGSGTGYLSTMVGLILGPNGINHGIEIHANVVEYAYEKLEKFKMNCNGVDVFEFCEPHFITGNIFELNSDRKYDRIYCGAACPEMYQERIKRHMKVGGILVVPCEDDLLKIVRTAVDKWESNSVLQVSFSTLLLPEENTSPPTITLNANPLCLQALCRTHIRTILREIAEKENAELTMSSRPTCKKKSSNSRNRRVDGSVVIPIFENAVFNERSLARTSNRLNFERLIFHNYSAASFRTFVRTLARDHDSDTEEEEDDEPENAATQNESSPTPSDTVAADSKSESSPRSLRAQKRHLNSKNVSPKNGDAASDSSKANKQNDPSTSQDSRRKLNAGDKRRPVRVNSCAVENADRRYRVIELPDVNGSSGEERVVFEGPLHATTSSNSGAAKTRQESPNRERKAKIENDREKETSDRTRGVEINVEKRERELAAMDEEDTNEEDHPKKLFKRDEEENGIDSAKKIDSKPSPGSPAPDVESDKYSEMDIENVTPVKKISGTDSGNNGKKIDSGSSERQSESDGKKMDIENGDKVNSESDLVDSCSTSDTESCDFQCTSSDPADDDGSVGVARKEKKASSKPSNGNQDSDEDDDSDRETVDMEDETPEGSEDEKQTDEEVAKETTFNDTLSVKYRTAMEKKILALPLPQPVKIYLNYDRAFIFSC